MIPEGELVVRIAWDTQRVRAVNVVSTRPFAISRVLCGRTPADVVAMVPLLFSVCGQAQRAAAATALEAAGATETAGNGATDEFAVMLETVQEYLQRLLIDWPQIMGRNPVASPVAAARRQIAAVARPANGVPTLPGSGEAVAALVAIAAESVYGASPSQWLALDGADALQAWIRRGATLPAVLLGELIEQMPRLGCSDVAPMPSAGRDALIAAVLPAMSSEPGFACAPTWNGKPVETGALARMRSHPLVAALELRCGNAVVTRMVARLVELATLLQDLARGPGAQHGPPRVQGFALEPGEGLAAVQTGRGLLLHRARADAGHVTSYQIVAPTEWNFHPNGALARGLTGLAVGDEAALKYRAELAVQALDPCVASRIEIVHA